MLSVIKLDSLENLILSYGLGRKILVDPFSRLNNLIMYWFLKYMFEFFYKILLCLIYSQERKKPTTAFNEMSINDWKY